MCLGCGAEFSASYPVTAEYWTTRKYCSRTCAARKKNNTPQTPEHIAKRTAAWKATISARVRECKRCRAEFNPTSPNQRYCSGRCFDAAHRKQRADAQGQRLSITPSQFAELTALYGTTCNICGAEKSARGRLCVDHDHSTMEIRGLLCHRCNTSLGLMRDDPALLQAAIDYLTKR